MSDVFDRLNTILAGFAPEQRAELTELAMRRAKQAIWIPNPGRQMQAYLSEADWLLYGGAAGGGKTDLLLGTALTSHENAVIFRRQGVDLRGTEDRLIEIIGTRTGYNATDMKLKHARGVLEFGALEKPHSELTWQGRPHDFIGFDEGGQLSLDKVLYVTGWLRSVTPGIRKRIVIATNPPRAGEGEWIMEWWAPWLDPTFPDPAEYGELRWAIVVDRKIRWVHGPGQTTIGDHTYTHESYTFILSLLDDNPFLSKTGYRARIENLPEPLRSQLLHGDFLAGREDHEWQVIPTEWARAAQARWRKAGEKSRTMIALAMDVAMGGPDAVTIASLHEDNWFAPLITKAGIIMTDPVQHAALLILTRRDGADMSLDATGGWGTGIVSHLKHQHEMAVHGIVFSRKSHLKDKTGKLGFRNLRAEMYWRFREALSPDSGLDVMLPPSPRLLGQLTTPRYTVHGTDILIEDKDAIRKRTGGSTDEGDAVIMAWHRRGASTRMKPIVVPGLPPIADWERPLSDESPWRNDRWMLQ